MNVLAEYWYLWILLVILAVAAFFAWSKAAQAARKRGEKRAEIEEKLKYEARLRKEYAVLTADVIADASQDTLLDGVVCHLQQRLEKQADMTAAFQACTEPEREMYALYYLCEDGVQKLSRFFRINGEPLLSLAPRRSGISMRRRKHVLRRRSMRCSTREMRSYPSTRGVWRLLTMRLPMPFNWSGSNPSRRIISGHMRSPFCRRSRHNGAPVPSHFLTVIFMQFYR